MHFNPDEPDEPFDCTVMRTLAGALQAAYPDKYVYYHYNPNAVIQGPMVFFNWVDHNDQHKRSDNNITKVEIVFHGGCIFITRDPQPARKPENIIAAFDPSEPTFDAEDIAKALRVHYESGGADKRNPALPNLGQGSRWSRDRLAGL